MGIIIICILLKIKAVDISPRLFVFSLDSLQGMLYRYLRSCSRYDTCQRYSHADQRSAHTAQHPDCTCIQTLQAVQYVLQWPLSRDMQGHSGLYPYSPASYIDYPRK